MQIINNNAAAPGLGAFCRWEFKPTGDLTADAAMGRRLASEYLAFQDDDFFAPSLGWIVQAIASLDRPVSSLETAFFHDLNSYLAVAVVSDPKPPFRVIDGGKS